MLCWVNGRPANELSVADRGLAYGDGLFETIVVRAGRPVRLDRHLARLTTGCQRLALNIDLTLLRGELLTFAAQLGDGVLKLILTRGDGLRGYATSSTQLCRRILQGSPLPAYPASNAGQGVQLFRCATRLAEQPLLAGLKHLNRLEQVLARAEWQDPAFAEGLLCDYSDRVIEGVFSNLFLVKDGELLTPELSRCGVAGVMRAEVLQQAESSAIACCVRDISYAELLAADELFLTNSLYGIWPVRCLDGHYWPVGPLTRKLQAILSDLPGG